MAAAPHVVILGAGFGGMGCAQRLRGAPVRVTIVDRHDYHTFQPLLYQVATDELSATEIGFPIREVLHGSAEMAFHQGEVRGVDLAHRQVDVEGLAPLDYDYLVLGLGATVNYFAVPGAAEHALPFYTMDDAIRLKNHILRTFEAVDNEPAKVEQGSLNFCIVGGGPTGVELAGALAELLQAELKQDYPRLPVEKARVVLYERGPDLLPSFAPKLRAYARQALAERGVDVRVGLGVERVAADSVASSDGQSIPTQTLIWAAGLQANPIAASLDVPLAHGGRVPVGADLRLAGRPDVFVVGDLAVATDARTGAPLPGLGAVALQAGRHAAASIARLVAGQAPQPFDYVNKGVMAQVGRGAAVVELPTGGTLTGRLAWLAWLGVHLTLLNGADEKASVFVDWGWNLATGARGKRIILGAEEP